MDNKSSISSSLCLADNSFSLLVASCSFEKVSANDDEDDNEEDDDERKHMASFVHG